MTKNKFSFLQKFNNECKQVRCFNAALQPSEISGVKRVVQEKLQEGVNEHGLTLTGFLFLHALFIEKGRLETTWTVLRKFGYNNDIKLVEDLFPVPIKRAPDQVTSYWYTISIMAFYYVLTLLTFICICLCKSKCKNFSVYLSKKKKKKKQE